MRHTPYIILACIIAFMTLPAHAEAPVIPCEVVAEYPHDTQTSTQGFFVADGVFYESSGGYNKSFLVKSDPKTGTPLLTHALDTTYFAEGITPYKDTLRLVTWQSGTGFTHSLADLVETGHFLYRDRGLYHEGWGLTACEGYFVLSSGTCTLRFHAPESFTQVRELVVTDNGKRVPMLNELECVNGLIYANIWKSDWIAIIDPATGKLTARLDISALRDRLDPESGVANGIAYDAKAMRLYVTGKHWDKVFEIAVPSQVD